jgi:hypothetical protein
MNDAPKPFCAHMRKHELPSIEWLRQRFSYDPETGIITGPRSQPIGHIGDNGYFTVSTTAHSGKRMTIRRGRLGFALKEGRWPFLMDHINRIRTDDRWTNLREATARENRRNSVYPLTNHISPRRTGARWDIRMDHHHTCRRDFCAAWKLRQQWLAERNAK